MAKEASAFGTAITACVYLAYLDLSLLLDTVTESRISPHAQDKTSVKWKYLTRTPVYNNSMHVPSIEQREGIRTSQIPDVRRIPYGRRTDVWRMYATDIVRISYEFTDIARISP